MDFARAIKSFVGHLEGTSKAINTISSYKIDLNCFEEFLKENSSYSTSVNLKALTLKDVEAFHEFLKAKGFRNNTRRRRVLTVRKFLAYLTKRKKLEGDWSGLVPAPYKVERVPTVVPLGLLLNAIKSIPLVSDLDRRNRLLFWMLAETGCRVSEVKLLRGRNLSLGDVGEATPSLTFEGKFGRKVPISLELAQEMKAFAQNDPDFPIFVGHTRYGALKTAITARGVELLVKAYAPRMGFSELTPRQIRHSCVIAWAGQGIERKVIQERLGLKTDYVFRSYDPLLKKGVIEGGNKAETQ